MNIKIIYEDQNVLVIDKPAGIIVFPERKISEKTLIDYLIENKPELKNVGGMPRYGIIHRLDKDTSGILLVAKTKESLIFFQKQFKNRTIDKKYIVLATGNFKDNFGKIETLIGRSPADPRKQKIYILGEKIPKNAREAITEYKVLKKFQKYTLLEVSIKTGRKHQIRAHLAFIYHPVAGDKLYGFKDSPLPKNLKRQFLHASYMKIQLPNGKMKEFESKLPKDLQKVLEELK